LIVLSIINSWWLNTSNSTFLLEEGQIPEIHLINFTDWGWLLILSVVTLIVWGLIVFQSKSKGSYSFGDVSESEVVHDSDDH